MHIDFRADPTKPDVEWCYLNRVTTINKFTNKWYCVFFGFLTVELSVAQCFLSRALKNKNEHGSLLKCMSIVFTFSYIFHMIYCSIALSGATNPQKKSFGFYEKLLINQWFYVIWDTPAILSFLLVNLRLVR